MECCIVSIESFSSQVRAEKVGFKEVSAMDELMLYRVCQHITHFIVLDRQGTGWGPPVCVSVSVCVCLRVRACGGKHNGLCDYVCVCECLHIFNSNCPSWLKIDCIENVGA